MRPNVGGLDRAARIFMGVVLLAISMTSNAIGLWGVLGMIPIVSGFMRFCPFYAMLGYSTRAA